jgi:hypothetical protein
MQAFIDPFRWRVLTEPGGGKESLGVDLQQVVNLNALCQDVEHESS